jgi:hypothetical protein
VWVDELDLADQPEAVIVPFAGSSRTASGSRSCAAAPRAAASARRATGTVRSASTTRPRWWSASSDRSSETGFEEVGLLSLSTADYSQVEPLVYNLSEKLSDRRVSVNLPSLRADAFSVGLAEAVSSGAQVRLHLRPGDRIGPAAARHQQDLHQRRHDPRRRGRLRQGLER